MGRKRYSSFVESSEDEFELSDVEASPLFSRLKRPRRPRNKDAAAPSTSPQRNSVQLEEDVNSSVVIPDSLDLDDNSSPESVAVSAPHTPNDPREEDTRETEAPSEKADDIDEKGLEEEDDDADADADDIIEIKEESDDKDAQQSPTKGKATNSERRQSRKVYLNESDSAEESAHDNDDDDAYNSAEDSPPEDDDDSEFDFSPQKSAKKKGKVAAKRPASRQKSQTPPKRKTATRKLATRKLAMKPGLSVPKPSAAAQSNSKSKSTSEEARPRLGARLPIRGLLVAKPSKGDKRCPQSSGKLPSAPMLRSGLSRKAAIPRLHAYLPR